MISGLLKDFIEIYRPHSEQNEYGELIQSYELYQRTRAHKVNNGGSRELQNSEVFYAYRVIFEIWNSVDIEETDIIHYDKKKYRILSIDENKKRLMKTITTELIDE